MSVMHMKAAKTPKILLTVAVGIVALGLESCSLLPWVKDEEPQVVEPVSTPAEEEAVVTEPQPPELGVELITPTDPNSQRQVIVQGRPDPFDPISMQPIVTVIPPEPETIDDPGASAAQGTSTQSPSASLPSTRTTASRPSTSSPSAKPANRPSASSPAATSPQAKQPKPTSSSSTDSQPASPPPNPAQLAESVVVSGIVEIGGKSHAILKAPQESSSRYVQPGQYVAMGEVLVKEIQYGKSPAVLLEQNGIEVLKSVGETAEVSYDNSASLALTSGLLDGG
ncbi:MAG: hypothetical protein ACFB4I_05150 [Cyanophyceae cyanobacterium]